MALPEGGTVDADLVDRIRRVPGVAAVTGDDRVPIGSPAAVGHGWDTYVFTGRPLAAGAAPRTDDEVVADTRLGVSPGDRIELVVGGISRSYRVSGTAETGTAAVFFTDAQAARLSAHPGRVDAIGVRMAPGADLGAVREIASAAGATTYAGKDRGKAEQSENQAAQSLLVEAGSAFGGYVVLLIVFVVAGTIGLSVRHRRRDLALLRAVAATPGQVRRMLVAEAALLALAGSAIGGPVGLLAARWVHGELVGRGFVPAGFPMAGGLFAVPAAIGTAVLVAVVAALIAARRVTAIKPIEALGEIAVEPRRSGPVRLIAGVLTLMAAGSSGAFTLGAAGSAGALAGAVGMLYLFVIAVALLAPMINAYAARLLTPVLPRIWRAGGYLAAANLRANAQGMATVLTALVLSVGFGGSVWFLQDNLERQTATQSSAGTLAERVLVAPGGLPADAAREIRELAGVQAATGVRRTQVVVRALGGIEPVGAQVGRPGGPHVDDGPRRAQGHPGRPARRYRRPVHDAGVLVRLGRRRQGGTLAGRRHPGHVGRRSRSTTVASASATSPWPPRRSPGTRRRTPSTRCWSAAARTPAPRWPRGRRRGPAPRFSTPPPVRACSAPIWRSAPG